MSTKYIEMIFVVYYIYLSRTADIYPEKGGKWNEMRLLLPDMDSRIFILIYLVAACLGGRQIGLLHKKPFTQVFFSEVTQQQPNS